MKEQGTRWPTVDIKTGALLAFTDKTESSKPKVWRIRECGIVREVGSGAAGVAMVAVDAQGRSIDSPMPLWAKHITKAENTLGRMFQLRRAGVISQAEWADAYGDSGSPAKRKALKEKYQDTPLPTAADRALGGDAA
jgi:hypothetical protein